MISRTRPLSRSQRRPRLRIALLAARSSIHTVRWANALCGRGHEVHLFSMHGVGDPVDDLVTLHTLPISAPIGYVLNLPFFRRALGSLRPDLLHTHYASGYGTLAYLCGFRPAVLSVWGSDVYEFPKRSRLHQLVVRANLRADDWVCSTSQTMAAHLEEVQRVDDVSVIPFGIDTDRFCPAPGSRNPDAITFGTVKALHSTYGIDILLRAFAEARQRLMEEGDPTAERLRLVVVGEGPDRTNLERLAKTLRIADGTTFVGRVCHDLVPQWLNRLDVFVAVSRYESFGVAALEASACGVPLLVSDADGLAEIVRDGVTGLIVGREDVASTAEAMVVLATNPDMRHAMGDSGRRHVLEQYEWNSNLEMMEDVYYAVRSRRMQRAGSVIRDGELRK